MILPRFAVITGLVLGLTNNAIAADTAAPYPEGYRNWLHVKTMLIEPGHPLENPFQGIHHIYANAKAVKGLNTGSYPDGSVLVFDLLQYTKKEQTIQEADRKLLGIMHKQSKQYASTGGWGFEGFAGDSKTQRLVKDGGKSCYACHTSENKTDYVFSQIRK